MKIRQLIAASLLSLGACVAFAQTPGSGLSAEEKEKRCQANPEKCAQIKERAEKRREENQARREEFKKKCDADPKACEEKKAQIREKLEERREKREVMKERMQNAPRPPAR